MTTMFTDPLQPDTDYYGPSFERLAANPCWNYPYEQAPEAIERAKRYNAQVVDALLAALHADPETAARNDADADAEMAWMQASARNGRF